MNGIASWSIIIRFFRPYFTKRACYLMSRASGTVLIHWICWTDPSVEPMFFYCFANLTAYQFPYTTLVFSIWWEFVASFNSFRKFSTHPVNERWLQNLKARFMRNSFSLGVSLIIVSSYFTIVFVKKGLNSWNPANWLLHPVNSLKSKAEFLKSFFMYLANMYSKHVR